MTILKIIVNGLLYRIFLYVPDPLLYFFISAFAYLNSLSRIVAHFNMEVKLYEGHRNGCPLRMLWIGTNKMEKYVLERLYGSEYQTTKLQSTNLIHLKLRLAKLSVQSDLIYIELNSLLPQLKGFKRIPKEVLTKMRVGDRNNKKYREAMKIVRQNGGELKEFKISKNLNQLRLFYDKLYAPHISSTYGEQSV